MLPALPTATSTWTSTTYSAAPVVTPFAVARMLELRQAATDTDFDLSFYDSYSYCDAFAYASLCDSAYLDCISDFDDYTDTAYSTAGLYQSITSCYCNYGYAYLSCYMSALSSQTCDTYFSLPDMSSYESYWFQQYCGTVPATLKNSKAKSSTGKPPTSVSLDFEPVTIVTLNSTPPVPTYTYTPIYNGSGSLLADDCGKTQFTLIEDASTVVWVPFVGCAKNKPHCCPWTAASAFLAATVTADTTVTLTTVVATTAEPTGTNAAMVDNAYPQAAMADRAAATLAQCAADYYALSGRCCPRGYWPFTRDLGGQTPCWSSLAATTRAPTLTAGLVGAPTATQKPTSAVVNIVWAMSYPVAAPQGLSKGAMAGIAVGALAGVATIAVLGVCLWRTRRTNKQLQAQQALQAQQPAVPPPAQQPGIQEMAAQGILLPQDQQQGMVQGMAGQPGYVDPQHAGVSPQDRSGHSAAPTSAGTPGTVASELSGGVSSTRSGVGLLAGGAGAVPASHSTGYPPPPTAEVGGHYQQPQQQQQQQQQTCYPPQQPAQAGGYYFQEQAPVQCAAEAQQAQPYQQVRPYHPAPTPQQAHQLPAESLPVEAAASPVPQAVVPTAQPLQMQPPGGGQQQYGPPQIQQVPQGQSPIYHQSQSPIPYVSTQQIQQPQQPQQPQQLHAQQY